MMRCQFNYQFKQRQKVLRLKQKEEIAIAEAKLDIESNLIPGKKNLINQELVQSLNLYYNKNIKNNEKLQIMVGDTVTGSPE